LQYIYISSEAHIENLHESLFKCQPFTQNDFQNLNGAQNIGAPPISAERENHIEKEQKKMGLNPCKMLYTSFLK